MQETILKNVRQYRSHPVMKGRYLSGHGGGAGGGEGGGGITRPLIASSVLTASDLFQVIKPITALDRSPCELKLPYLPVLYYSSCPLLFFLSLTILPVFFPVGHTWSSLSTLWSILIQHILSVMAASMSEHGFSADIVFRDRLWNSYTILQCACVKLYRFWSAIRNYNITCLL